MPITITTKTCLAMSRYIAVCLLHDGGAYHLGHY